MFLNFSFTQLIPSNSIPLVMDKCVWIMPVNVAVPAKQLLQQQSLQRNLIGLQQTVELLDPSEWDPSLTLSVFSSKHKKVFFPATINNTPLKLLYFSIQYQAIPLVIVPSWQLGTCSESNLSFITYKTISEKNPFQDFFQFFQELPFQLQTTLRHLACHQEKKKYLQGRDPSEPQQQREQHRAVPVRILCSHSAGEHRSSFIGSEQPAAPSLLFPVVILSRHLDGALRTGQAHGIFPPEIFPTLIAHS